MSAEIPHDSQWTGAEYDEAITAVRASLVLGLLNLGNGGLSAPSLRFASEPGLGMYRAGPRDIRFAVNAEDVLNITDTKIIAGKKVTIPDGSAAAPGLAFSNSNASGLYRAGVGDIRLSVLGSDIAKFQTTAFELSQPLRAYDGNATRPGIGFANAVDTGFYRNATNDIRLSIGGTDVLCMGFVTISGATNAPSLGLGKFPERGGLHLLVPNSAATGTGIQLENTDPTDGNATGFSIRCTTTGVGGGTMAEVAKFNVRIDTHNHATRESHMDFAFTVAGTTKFIQFIGLSGERGIRSDSGALTVQAISGTLLLNTGSGNNDVQISPAGTGKIVFDVAKPLRIATGTNQRAGNATLVAGTVTVANTTVTANTQVIATRKTGGGTLGFLTFTVSAGVSFTITSSSATDTSVVSYFLIEVS